MKSSEEINKAKKEVATVAVMNGDKILMGQRNDTGRWTNPGGHLNEGEHPEEGAKRELHEEAGIKANKVKHLVSKDVVTHTGKEMKIHAFVVNHDGKQKPTPKNDPDKEVKKWLWISTKGGLPEHVKANLHSPKNVVLQHMGLIKALGSKGGKVVGYTSTGKPIYESSKKMEHVGFTAKDHKDAARFHKVRGDTATSTEDAVYHYGESAKHKDLATRLDRLGKSFLEFALDLMKGMGGYKYIRKYQRGGRWVYVYKEPEQHARHLPEEAMNHIRQLAELGDEHARNLHENIEEVPEEKLNTLRQLADLGDDDAHKHLKEHYGIDRKQERTEEAVAPSTFTSPSGKNDPIYHELAPNKRSSVLDAVLNTTNASIFDHLRGHTNSDYFKKLEQRPGGIDGVKNRIKDALQGSKSVGEALEKLHHALKEVDTAHSGLAPSANDSVRRAGSYGNHAYNQVVQKLSNGGVLPREYAELHQRTANDDSHKVMGLAEVQRKKQEREEQERRELAGLHGTMAHYMSTIVSSRMSKQKILELNQAIKSVFGKELKKEDWPYHFEGTGLKTKIQDISISPNGFSLSMQVEDANGNEMMSDWARNFRKGDDGRPNIYNSIMRVRPDARGSVQIGNLINQGQRKLMKSLPNGGTIGVTAALDVGGYNWANQGFSFKSNQELNSMRDNFGRFLAEKGIHLTSEDLKKFKQPVHFAAFTNGKKYLKNLQDPIKLSPQQIQTKSLSGVEGENKLTPDEIRSGKSKRMMVHLGKLFLLGRSWSGTWDSKVENAATKFGDKYYELRERASKVLEPEYLDVQEQAKTGQRATAPARPQQVTPRNSLPGASGQSQRLIDWWTRGANIPGTPRRNIRMTDRRFNRLASLSVGDLQHFHDNAGLTPAAKTRIRQMIRERGGNGRS